LKRCGNRERDEESKKEKQEREKGWLFAISGAGITH
jgi:hypothetical protein